MIRVAVVAPGMALRIGLREVLRGLPNVDVVAEAASPRGLPPVPNDPYLNAHLADTMRRKLNLMRRAATMVAAY